MEYVQEIEARSSSQHFSDHLVVVYYLSSLGLPLVLEQCPECEELNI